MNDRHARTEFGTHRVENQPTVLADVNLWAMPRPSAQRMTATSPRASSFVS